MLAWIGGGRCQSCGVPLSADFHADHIVPFSRGGQTVVNNGQALCPPCNLRKGNR
jgi:5-methylcytosine-specific restriction endonuclease McrA